MKWRHWAILIVLVLLNYIIFSTALTQWAEQRRPGPQPTRTPLPTFESIQPTPLAWIVLPTHTALPTRAPITPAPTEVLIVTTAITLSGSETTTGTLPVVQTDTPMPLSSTPTAQVVIHTVKEGETLSLIAATYGVTLEALLAANSLTDANLITAGQMLIIPGPSQVPPSATPPPPTPLPQPTQTPKPKPPAPTATRKPPTATPVVIRSQFTAELIWHPLVAPNCAGPGISKESVIRDAGGNPVNGVRVEVNCYDNVWLSHPSGTPGEYDAGHYDFAFGQGKPQDWTCTARVADVNGQPVANSDVVSIHFDTNTCQPDGDGHQVAIVNWTKHW